jgi:maltodextrin utilization protein YvdJ
MKTLTGLKQKLTQSILKFKGIIGFRDKNSQKDELVLELEAIKREIKKIKEEYERRIAFLENELLKIKSDKKLQSVKKSEEIESSEDEDLKLIGDIETLRKEVLQVLEELERE